MIDVAHLDSLYKAARIIVWVEDTLTRDYLQVVWNTTDVAFYVAGGSDHIPRIITAARQLPTPIAHVFGVLDRDFGFDNKAKWDTADNFYLPRHEMENYLLDVASISSLPRPFNNRNRTQADISNEMLQLARKQPAWLACRSVMKSLRTTAVGEYPNAPSLQKVTDIQTAIQHIMSSTWYWQALARLQTSLPVNRLQTQLAQAEQGYQSALMSDDWLTQYSGKEIFRQLRSYVYQPSKNPGTPDNDFARAIGMNQLANNRVPQDITDLLAAMRRQVGLPVM